MNLTAKSEYACLAMLELAHQHDVGEVVCARQIAERHGIPSPFLVQILQDLKRADLVTSTRGASGGFRLVRPPEAISLADVLDAVEGEPPAATCAAEDSPLAPLLMEVCHDLAATKRERLDSTTLAELVQRAHAGAEPMWYI